jgi:hypothetical protein
MILNNQYDCLILSHPEFLVIDELAKRIKQENLNVAELNLKLSELLITVPMAERSRLTNTWVPDYLTSFRPGPVVCTHPGLLFEPQLNIDPLALFRQIARITRLVILWLGDFTEKELFYAIPAHQHYRTWRISDFLPYQPKVILHRIS